MHVFLLIEKAL